MTSQNPNLAALSDAGVSVWLDDLSRDRLKSGNLQELIDTKSVVGVTTNPSIFQAAFAQATPTTRRSPNSPNAAPTWTPRSAQSPPTTSATRATCCARSGRPPWSRRPGVDRGRPAAGPRNRQDHRQAIELWKIVDRPNLLIKIPATKAGLPAITAVLAEGISVNVTLIFSVERHREVMDAYLAGLEKAQQGRTRSVQDPFGGIIFRLPGGHRNRQAAGEDRPRGGARTARSGRRCQRPAGLRRLPGGLRRRRIATQALKANGARVQRPLWASTGVKNPAYSDTLYVTELVAPYTVNTMPEKTLDAVADHGDDHRRRRQRHRGASQAVFDKLTAAGIDLADVFVVLENEGVEKFEDVLERAARRETQKQLTTSRQMSSAGPRLGRRAVA